MNLPVPLANEAAIHRLVDDILVYIFVLNATAPDPDCREHATTVASSQVCMRWRSIALHCPTIWGPIIHYSQHSLKWIETLLDRSHPSLLDFGSRITRIDTIDLEDGGQGVLELVFNHIDRLRIFNLKLPESCWELVCSRFLQLPAPNLEFVNVTVFSTFYTRRGKVQQLTHPLFHHHAPNLQNLQLSQCRVDFTSPILSRLTELYVRDIANSWVVPTVHDWLNIFGGMPSLRWVTLIRAISTWSSSTVTNVIYPIIHLASLEMLSVDDGLRESVTLIEHLIVPPRCGLRFRCDDAHIWPSNQPKFWAIIEKKVDSWAKNVPNRYLEVWNTTGVFSFGNVKQRLDFVLWGTEAKILHDKQYIHLLDPVMTVTLHLPNPQDTFPSLLSLFAIFERTFFDTTHLDLSISNGLDNGPENFLPLVDMFRGFVNLKEMTLGLESLLLSLLPLLQRPLPNSVLLPALQSLRLHNTMFKDTSSSLLRVADFLRWRGEQGFPVQEIHIAESWINRKLILTHIQFQDTVVEIDDSNYWDSESVDDVSEDDVEEDDN